MTQSVPFDNDINNNDYDNDVDGADGDEGHDSDDDGDNDDVLGDDEDPISPVAPFDDKKSALRKSASRAVTKHCW